MRRILLILFVFSNPISAQNWVDMGLKADNAVRVIYSDTIDNRLYLGGNFIYVNDSLPVYGFTYWDGNEYDTLKQIYTVPMIDILRKDTALFVGGFMMQTPNGAPCRGIAYWKDNDWHCMGSGANSPVLSIVNYQNQICITGSFDTLGNENRRVGCWDGNSWNSVGVLDFEDWILGDLVVFQNNLYVSGNFTLNNNFKEVAYWDGLNWNNMSGGVKGNNAHVNVMCLYDGNLYVAGYFFKNDGNVGNNIMMWDGEQWHDVGGGVNHSIADLKVFNNQLYACGTFTEAGGVPAQYIAKWNGYEWCGFGSSFDNIPLCLGIHNNELYVGGGFYTIDGDSVYHFAKWIGGDYVDTCGAIINVKENKIEYFELEIYPNPANNVMTIKTKAVGKSEHFIYDVNGKKLSQSSIFNGQSIIDLSTLAEGLYLLQVQTEQGSISRKFVKTK